VREAAAAGGTALSRRPRVHERGKAGTRSVPPAALRRSADSVPSTLIYQLSAVSYQLSAVGCRLSATGCPRFAFRRLTGPWVHWSVRRLNANRGEPVAEGLETTGVNSR